MNHEEAAMRQSVDRYLLRQLSGEEREEFEEHLFGCPFCTEEVQLGMTFEANARAVFGEEATEEPRGASNRLSSLLGMFLPKFEEGGVRLSRPAFSLALLLLLLVPVSLGMQTVGLFWGVAAVQTTVPYHLKNTRSAEDPPLRFPRGVDEITVSLRLKDSSYPVYQLDFSGPGDRIIEEIANPQSPIEEVGLLLSRWGFGPGEWRLAIYGLGESGSDQRTQIDEFRFRIEKD